MATTGFKEREWTDEEVLLLAQMTDGAETTYRLFEGLAPRFGRTPQALLSAWSRFGMSTPGAKRRTCNLCGRLFFSAGNRRCGRFFCKQAARRAA